MDAERSVRAKQQAMEAEAMEGKISLEERNRALVALAAENARAQSDAKAYGVAAAMKAFAGVEPGVIQALATTGMQPDQIVALAFRSLAENASKIGELNMSPELLRELMKRGKG
jgi:hypothetical protein